MKRNLSLAIVVVLLLALAVLVIGCGATSQDCPDCPPVIVDVQYPEEPFTALEEYIVEEDHVQMKQLTVQENGAAFESEITQGFNIVNIGQIPSVLNAAITYQSTGALFTVPASEIWVVDRCIVRVDTNFDCTGDDCTMDIGDGGDADGFLNLADADLQAAATDYTGAAAGWQGIDGATPAGAYQIGGPHVYSATDTIDIAVGGTSPAAGAGEVYCFVTRLE